MAPPRPPRRGSLPPRELQIAAAAAGVLVLCLVLPWYHKSYFATSGAKPVAVSADMSAFGAFSFVEAAVLVVAAGVLYLVWARARGRAFHLPGGDGSVIAVAGGWAMLLLIWRMFDTPDAQGAGTTIGVQWGIFAALLAAGGLLAAGLRVRATAPPEPINPAAEEDVGWQRPTRRERPREARRPVAAEALSDALRDRPAWEGEPPDDLERRRRRERRATERGDPPPTA